MTEQEIKARIKVLKETIQTADDEIKKLKTICKHKDYKIKRIDDVADEWYVCICQSCGHVWNKQ